LRGAGIAQTELLKLYGFTVQLCSNRLVGDTFLEVADRIHRCLYVLEKFLTVFRTVSAFCERTAF